MTFADDEDRLQQIMRRPENCYQLRRMGMSMNGIYTLTVPITKERVRAYCDMEYDGGGWTVGCRKVIW